MRRIRNIAFSLTTPLFLCFGFAVATLGQAAPTPAPTLPPGMVGSRTDDPRAKLSPGLYDAGEQALGLKHLQLLRKPDSFQLGTDNADDPKVKQMLTGFGIADPSKIPPAVQVGIAQGAFTNSDIAFQGNHVFVGNYYGINIYDTSDAAKARLVTSIVCPGGQGDPSVY